jgi:peptidyl-prolyl cis-trans isomerase D
MLALMRKHAKNWFIKILLFMIIIVFVAYFGSTKSDMDAAVAVIDGKIITRGEYYKEYQQLSEMYRNQLGAKFTEQALKDMNIKQQAFDSLIQQALFQKKADELHIQVSDDEVKAVILANPAFRINGVFDERAYQQMLRANKLTVEEFEALQKKLILAMKLEMLIQGGVKVSDREVHDLYRFQNEKIDIAFARITPGDFARKVAPTTSDLEAYLKEHGDEFRVPDQIRVSYIVFPGTAYAAAAKITEADIADYYNRNKDTYAAKSKDGKKSIPPLAAIREKVVDELKKVQGMYAAYDHAKKAHDTIYQEEKMDAYAGQHKLEIKTTGFFTAAHIPAEFKSLKDFSRTVFALQKDEISNLLSDDKAYYLFKIAEKKSAYVPALSDIRKEVERRYVEAEARRLAMKEAEAAAAMMKKGESLTKIAQGKGLKIEDTGLFLPGSAIPKLGNSDELTEALYQLSAKKPYADTPFYIGGQYVLIQFKQKGSLDNADFAAKKDGLKLLLLRIKMKETMQSWIEGTKAVMIKDGRLTIKKEAKEL